MLSLLSAVVLTVSTPKLYTSTQVPQCSEQHIGSLALLTVNKAKTLVSCQKVGGGEFAWVFQPAAAPVVKTDTSTGKGK